MSERVAFLRSRGWRGLAPVVEPLPGKSGVISLREQQEMSRRLFEACAAHNTGDPEKAALHLKELGAMIVASGMVK